MLESGSEPAELRFVLGPATGPRVTLTRETASADERVAALFRGCPDLTEVTLAAGTLVAKIADARRWSEVLLPLFDAVTAAFIPPRGGRARPPARAGGAGARLPSPRQRA